MKKIILIFIATAMILGAVGHVAYPEMYSALIPSFIPEFIAHLFAIIAEVAIGLALIIPKFRKYGGLGFMILMIIFLPIHAWDMLKEEHFIGTKTIALVRIAVQGVMIYAGWWIYKKYKN
jgi:uncharacterized membrane protein